MPKIPSIHARFVEPMLTKLVETPPKGDGWQYEIKLDGYRAVVVKNRDSVEVFSRRGNRFTKRYPIIATAFERLVPDTVLDGEIVALDQDGRPDFQLLQNWSPSQPIFFYAFDMPTYAGQDLTKLPLTERRRRLQKALTRTDDPVRFSPTFEIPVDDLIDVIRQQKLEGIVAKKADSRYEPGKRSDSWLKCKVPKSRELIIGGYLPGPYVFDSLIVGHVENRKLLFVSKVRNGFTPALRLRVAKSFKGLETAKCPFVNLPETRRQRFGQALTVEAMKKCRWLKPTIRAIFEFTDWTADNHLRHARFVALSKREKPQRFLTTPRLCAAQP